MTTTSVEPKSNQEQSTRTTLELYQQVVPVAFIEGLPLEKKQQRGKQGIFTLSVVLWLMIFQRLHPKGTLWVAVQRVICGLPAELIRKPSKRVREGTVSSHTGGYNQARQKLPLSVVEQVSDQVFQQLSAAKTPAGAKVEPRWFLLDGSTLLMPRTPSLEKAYPPGCNQHGESHWPILRVLVAHDLRSGIALRPQWGSVNGSEAVSEQSLSETLLKYVPEGAGVLGDRNFGVFSVAWDARQKNHPVLLRLTEGRSKRAFGLVSNSGTDRRVEWRPSRWDRDSHPELPRDALMGGRLIIRKVYPSDGSSPFKLYLFTTSELDADEVVRIYGLRWNVETDLRSLKKTIRLEMLECRTSEMVAKELILAVVAYNLVRTVIEESAQQTHLEPRQYSFSKVQDVLNIWLPHISSLPSEAERQAAYQQMMRCVAQCKLYKRKGNKSYPRAVWHRPCPFPRRTTASSKHTIPPSPASMAERS